MLKFGITWLVSAGSFILTANLVPGFEVKNFTYALIAAGVLGILNAIVRPVLVFFTLPLTILSLGLFLFVINAFTIGLVSYIVPGFKVDGFFPALIGSIVLSIISTLINRVAKVADLE